MVGEEAKSDSTVGAEKVRCGYGETAEQIGMAMSTRTASSAAET